MRPPLRPLRGGGGNGTTILGSHAEWYVGQVYLCFRESIRELICIVKDEQDGDADKRSVMSIASGWWASAGVVQEEQLWMSIL